MRAGIDCVAVTDLHSGDWIDELKSALDGPALGKHPEFRPLYLFPGAEIVASGGTHILAVFDPAKGKSDIDGLLAAVDFRGQRGRSDHVANATVVDIAEKIVQAGGIAIPSRVDSDRGLWSIGGNTLVGLLDCGQVFAVETVDAAAPPPSLYEVRRLNWPSVLGSETPRLTRSHPPQPAGVHYTWIKMEQPALDGVRLALLDGERYSVQRSDVLQPPKPPRPPQHFIQSIEIAEARFIGRHDAARLNFSPWFNVLIGGRGSGKSTVLHCLRLAARREGELRSLGEHSDVRSTFERFSRVPTARDGKGGLRDQTHVIWTVSRHGVPHRVHWLTQPSSQSPVVEEWSPSGTWVAAQAQHIDEERFPIRLFGQGQIAELAGHGQAALLNLIDEGAGCESCKRDIEQARRAYVTARSRIREIDTQLGRRDQISVALADNQRKLSALEDAGHAEVLWAFRRNERQQRELDRVLGAARRSADRIDELAAELHSDDIAADAFDDASDIDGHATAAIEATRQAIQTASDHLFEVAAQLREAAERQHDVLSGSPWQHAAEEIRAAHSTTIASLGDDSLADPAQHTALAHERQRLMDEQADLTALETTRGELETEAKRQFDRLTAARRALTERRSRFLDETLTGNEFVRMRLIPYGSELAATERSFREAIDITDGRFPDDIGGPESTDPDAVANRLLRDLPDDDAVRRDAVEGRLAKLRADLQNAGGEETAFRRRFDNHLATQFQRRPELLDSLLTWFPPDGLRVEYSPTSDGSDFTPIEQGSEGQRAAAMLAFLLAHGDEPLVLDQPEDDLDNQLIYSLVVQQIRENKLRRQIIAVTHNPNVVVNGDAEMLHVLDFLNGQCNVVEQGSMQSTDMREQVCRVMEGGREALEHRYRRLEDSLSDV